MSVFIVARPRQGPSQDANEIETRKVSGRRISSTSVRKIIFVIHCFRAQGLYACAERAERVRAIASPRRERLQPRRRVASSALAGEENPHFLEGLTVNGVAFGALA